MAQCGLASQVAQKLAVQLVCASAACEALAIDEERRRTVYVAVRATLKILVNAFEIRVVSHVLAEALRVQSDLARVLPQVHVVQRLLVLEQYVVHCPEVVLALRSGAFGCLGGVFGVSMLRPREVAVHEAKLTAEPVPDLLDLGIRHATKRALKIAVLDQSDRRFWRPQGMVPLANRHYQAGWM